MKRRCYNITNHLLTPEQVVELRAFDPEMEIVELPPELKKAWGSLSPATIEATCSTIDEWLIAVPLWEYDLVILQGHQAAVVRMLKGLRPDMTLFAHTERKSEETVLPDGTVSKKSVFQHQGFHNYENFERL